MVYGLPLSYEPILVRPTVEENNSITPRKIKTEKLFCKSIKCRKLFDFPRTAMLHHGLLNTQNQLSKLYLICMVAADKCAVLKACLDQVAGKEVISISSAVASDSLSKDTISALDDFGSTM